MEGEIRCSWPRRNAQTGASKGRVGMEVFMKRLLNPPSSADMKEKTLPAKPPDVEQKRDVAPEGAAEMLSPQVCRYRVTHESFASH
ncbi:UNVERIFIED_CONTAM: hypothetical protein K2H54_029971 [Gekko kuhli]